MEAFPYADVDSSLRAMAGKAEGFGRSAVGGLHGSLHSVTTLAGMCGLFSSFEIIAKRIPSIRTNSTLLPKI